ncbi:nucleolar protein 16 [Aethina tumida]|uniref:nucleolar protein 16 n=1 Tax=Aethina tumida TaxID=116153 RepID=UPI00096AEB7C|nr:nucleolar protein 16 [Aethina tumida]
MVKLRKQRRRKVYRYNVNRKRLRNKICGVGSIGCKEVKDAWERGKSIPTNMKEMGLSYDPNVTIKIPSSKKEYKNIIASSEWQEEELNEEEQQLNSKKLSVVEALEADAKAPRPKRLNLPNSQVEWVTYLIKKYGSDYRAMARDRKNYNQETWKQIRQKIRLFKKIPQQYNAFLKENGLEAIVSDNENMSDDEL